MAGALTSFVDLPGARRLVAVTLAVVMLHGLGVEEFAEIMLEARERGAAPPPPKRLEVAFVRELAPAAPPVAPAPVTAPPRPAQRLRPVAKAASAPPEFTSMDTPLPVPDPTPVPPEVAAPPRDQAQPPEPSAAASAATAPASAAAASAPADAVAAASASTAAPFQWPPSTRLSYAVVGNYRGEVQGKAEVQWIRDGERYQVHLDFVVGPAFAPLVERRMTSDGVLVASGLAPERYYETQKSLFGRPREARLRFEPQGQVTLADGRVVEGFAGAQDSASQFVQLAFLFNRRPELLVPGKAIDLALALPRRVDRWIYDVVDEQTLDTPFGPLPTVHLKPRREAGGGTLTAEIWFAPSLRYLPARILIRQDAQTYLDLTVDRLPQLAAEAP